MRPKGTELHSEMLLSDEYDNMLNGAILRYNCGNEGSYLNPAKSAESMLLGIVISCLAHTFLISLHSCKLWVFCI